MSAPILTVEHLTMRFGGLTAVNDLSFFARAREITALIGPNGAGKTTLFNCITGFYKPTVGKLRLAHPDDGAWFLLERLPEFRIAREARVARTFQNVRLFAGMTLLENLLVAQHNALMVASGYTLLGLFGSRAYAHAQASAIDKACYWLDRVGLAELAPQPADRHGDRAAERVGVLIPDPLQQVLGGNHAPVGDEELLEDPHLLAGERQRPARPADPAAGPVEHDVATHDHRDGGRGAPGQRPDPGDKLLECERLA